MKLIKVSLVACLLGLAAGCSAGDGGTDAQTDTRSDPPASAAAPAVSTPAVSPQASLESPVSDATTALLSRSRRPRPPPTNPCAAVSCLTNTSCEVVDGQAVCVPIDPGGSPEPSKTFCGGFAGIACPGSGSCVDDPSDGCDPARGGADCGGICECNIRALCVRGSSFDASPDVCACVPQQPEPDPCAAALCPAPSSCDVVNGEAVCTPIPPSGSFCGGIAAIQCPGAGSCVDNPSDGCDPARGGADCGGICACNIRALCIRGSVFDASPEVCACVPEQPNPCAAVLCPAPSSCDVVNGEAVCTPIAPSGPFCGGIAAFACPGSGSCVDNPADDCDPKRGGADCGGICECQIRALCIQGFVFDPSPEVCACVAADGGSGQACSADAH